MAMKCEHCGRGKVAGHAVSHAKNRTRRFFKPNLQKLKVMINGKVLRVKLCTRCIKRMHRDGRIGKYNLIKQVIRPVSTEVPKKIVKETEVMKKKETVKKIEKVVKVEKVEKKEPAVPTLDIASIVGKKE